MGGWVRRGIKEGGRKEVDRSNERSNYLFCFNECQANNDAKQLYGGVRVRGWTLVQ